MGSGILLLTAMEMADMSLKPENKGKQFLLYALDISQPALGGLMKYIQAQVLKAAEKKVVLCAKYMLNVATLLKTATSSTNM